MTAFGKWCPPSPLPSPAVTQRQLTARVVLAGSESLESNTILKAVSFTTVLDEGAALEIFAFISVDERLDTTVCHLFQCQPGVPDAICQVCGSRDGTALPGFGS